MRRKFGAALLAAMVATGILAGCGSNGTTDTASTADTVVEESVVEAADDQSQTSEEAESQSSQETTKETDSTISASTEDTESVASDAAGETDSRIADSSEMVDVESVVEDWMVPVLASSLNDGTYPVTVASSSSMFKIESAELVVADGEMKAVMTMGGTGYLHLFMGTPEEAVSAGEDDYISFVENEDGAHTFTIPIEALDQGLDCAAFSKRKEKWYARTLVVRSDSLPLSAWQEDALTTVSDLGLSDGEYVVNVTLSGGSGRASVQSPATVRIEGDSAVATVVWSSSNYDYMIVDGTKYDPVSMDPVSTFEIPVTVFDRPMPVTADTTAMSKPYEIEYTLTFDSETIE